MKPLKDSSLSLQDSDKSCWPLGFQTTSFPSSPCLTTILSLQALGVSELGEQVVVHGTSWKSDNMVPSPRTGEEEQQNTKLQGVCCLIKSVYCVQCYGDATRKAHSWA